MLLTEETLNKIKDEDCLRENINRLDRMKERTSAQQELLESLIEYRAKNCSYPSLAYYSYEELYYLFD